MNIIYRGQVMTEEEYTKIREEEKNQELSDKQENNMAEKN